MILCRFHVLIILLVIKHLHGERKILGGELLTSSKSYLVYFVNSEYSTRSYDSWTCGGALVHSRYVITAAACLQDVTHLYVVAGYLKYVSLEKIDTNACTSTHKKKVIYTCVPKAYEFDYGKVEKWASIDIGVAKVDSQFFQRYEYIELCTHKPVRIPINYNPTYQMPGIDAIVMGWGHLDYWRKPGDDTVYIQENARYASVRIMSKRKCKEYYKDHPELQKNIDKYMICTMDHGEIDQTGYAKVLPDEFKDGCEEEKYNCRRNLDESSGHNTSAYERKYGFCQNDHGGPLVTWIGGKEHLIGVASVFRVDKEGRCQGPYLFTSTQCNGAFLNCVLEADLYGRRSSMCKLPARKRGFEMIHRYISWPNHTLRGKSSKRKKEKFTKVPSRTVKIPDRNENVQNVQIRTQISIRDIKH